MARGKLTWKHKGQLKNVRLFQLLIFTSRASFSTHKNAEKQTKPAYFFAGGTLF